MITIKVTNQVGLHARPAAVFATEAKKFTSAISVIKDGSTYNGKSPMMIMAAGIACGDTIIIKAEGADAKEAELALAECVKRLE